MCENDYKYENNSSAHISVSSNEHTFKSRRFVVYESLKFMARLTKCTKRKLWIVERRKERHRQFRDGRISFDNNPRSGRPSTVNQENTNTAIFEIIDTDQVLFSISVTGKKL